MVRQFERQARLLTYLVTRLIPWLLLSLGAIGAGCEPSPWLQIHFELPTGKNVPLQKVDVVVTITDKSTQMQSQGKATHCYRDRELDKDCFWIGLPPGTPGWVSVSLAATISHYRYPCFTSPSGGVTRVKFDGHTPLAVNVLLQEQAGCASAGQDLTVDDNCQDSELIGTHTVQEACSM